MFVYKGVHGQSMRVKDVIAVLHDTLLKTLVERAVAQACILKRSLHSDWKLANQMY
jgi:hypothetical protein